ncbi:Hypothetical predicted protein [Olea europaea subsp. europaea]|uniref:Uncharacterized protein n=1 Tax=Olea europaea subsp. europaea TaxID=158383 RepID=A0A8S0SK95_OLEEU|nr:Hypothetical predicted protein [Olea europaea subsp. europaea]
MFLTRHQSIHFFGLFDLQGPNIKKITFALEVELQKALPVSPAHIQSFDCNCFFDTSFAKDVNLVYFVLLQEKKEYKEYKDNDCRELYRYKVLFGDVFDCDKYAVTPSQACRTGFAMFEDSAHEDHRDKIPVDVESSSLSDEGGVAVPHSAAMDESGPHSGDKRKATEKRSKEKRKKFSSWDVSYSLDRATSASKKIATKIDHFIEAAVSDLKTCMSELLATGRLQKQTDLYFYTCKFLSQRANRELGQTSAPLVGGLVTSVPSSHKLLVALAIA